MSSKKKVQPEQAQPPVAAAPQAVAQYEYASASAALAAGLGTIVISSCALVVEAPVALAAGILRGLGLTVKGAGHAIKVTGAVVDSGGKACWQARKRLDAEATKLVGSYRVKTQKLDQRMAAAKQIREAKAVETRLAKAKPAEAVVVTPAPAPAPAMAPA